MAGVEKGKVVTVQWCHEVLGMKLDAWCCVEAAKGWYLELLKWLRSKGVPWTRLVLMNAMKKKRLDIIKWVHQNGGDSL